MEGGGSHGGEHGIRFSDYAQQKTANLAAMMQIERQVQRIIGNTKGPLASGSPSRTRPERQLRYTLIKTSVRRPLMATMWEGKCWFSIHPDAASTSRKALEKAGVEFTNGKRPGVRLRG
jgi:hypothetical protein